MANTAIIRDACGVPAMFVGSKTGKDDAALVFIRVGDEERRMRWAEWNSLPAWTGDRPSWVTKHQRTGKDCYLTPEYPSDQLAQWDRDSSAHPVATL